MSELLLALHGYFFSPILSILFYALLAYVILGWLMIGNVVDSSNQTVRSIYNFLHQIIEPIAAPIRRFVPPLGNLDLSILLLALSILFLRDWLLPRIFIAIPF